MNTGWTSYKGDIHVKWLERETSNGNELMETLLCKSQDGHLGGPRPVAMLLGGTLLSMVSREELVLEVFQDHHHLETLGTKSSLALGAHLPAQHCVHFASEGQVQGSVSS